MLRFSIIICTRNRPISLGRLLETVLQNTIAIGSVDQIIIIDSSVSSESEELIAGYKGRLPIQFVKKNLSATLPKKRNAAIKVLTGASDVVFFLDDDVELDSAFFESALICFENPRVIGVGGRDINKSSKAPKRWQELLKLTSTQQGAILASGQNVEYVNSSEEIQVEWISGAVMSFRTSLLQRIKFDEFRNFDGEDVDFTFRASKFGILLCSPNVKYQHMSSLSNVPNKNHHIRDLITHRCLLVLKSDGKVRFMPTLLSIFVLGLAMFLKGVQARNTSIIYLGVRHIVLALLSPLFMIYLFVKTRNREGRGATKAEARAA